MTYTQHPSFVPRIADLALTDNVAKY